MDGGINLAKIRKDLGVTTSFVVVEMFTTGDTRPKDLALNLPYSVRTIQRVIKKLAEQELITKTKDGFNITTK